MHLRCIFSAAVVVPSSLRLRGGVTFGVTRLWGHIEGGLCGLGNIGLTGLWGNIWGNIGETWLCG